MNSRIVKFIVFAVMMAAILLVFWLTGLKGLWTDGMAYIANNTKDYTDTNGHVVQGEYSMVIDLAHLESNIGKELYNDGAHKIYVSWIDNTGSMNTGGYRIGFRSSGPYSLTAASLISGVQHVTINENTFRTAMSAKMKATYNNNHYNSSEYGLSGLNYKDGDDFSFYIFPSEAYNDQKISLNESDEVQLTVTGLFNNIWSKK